MKQRGNGMANCLRGEHGISQGVPPQRGGGAVWFLSNWGPRVQATGLAYSAALSVAPELNAGAGVGRLGRRVRAWRDVMRVLLAVTLPQGRRPENGAG